MLITAISNLVSKTKKYKYYVELHQFNITEVWGETIKKMGVMIVMAMAALLVPAMSQGSNYGTTGTTGNAAAAGAASYASMGASGVDILGGDIFETDSGASRFNTSRSTNFDSLVVGDDKANAFGDYWSHGVFGPQATAQNNLEINKSQMSGNRTCCFSEEVNASSCRPCNPQVNLEKIRIGGRTSFAYGNALAQNNIKIVTNQQ